MRVVRNSNSQVPPQQPPMPSYAMPQQNNPVMMPVAQEPYGAGPQMMVHNDQAPMASVRYLNNAPSAKRLRIR
ncbi:hypothetical protein COOONC_15647 [Cooperia oncophora]